MEAEESDASLQQITLLACIASPENLQALVEDGARLQESIQRARDLIMEKKELALNPNRPIELQMVQEHIKPQDHPPTDSQCPQTQSQRDQVQDVLSCTELKQKVGSWAGDLQVYVDKNSQASLERSGAVKVIFLSWFSLFLFKHIELEYDAVLSEIIFSFEDINQFVSR